MKVLMQELYTPKRYNTSMFRYEFDTKYLCWQISPSGDLTVGSSISALSMKLASKGEQICDGWRGCFDFDSSVIVATSHYMDDKHRIVQTHPVSILSFSTQDMPETTKAALTKYFIENTDGIMALTKVSDDYINGVREQLKVAQNFETFHADELIKLAQNEALIRRILTYFPRWSTSTVSSFLLWWGAVAGLPAEAIAQTIQNNPAEVKQKADEFQSQSGISPTTQSDTQQQTAPKPTNFDNALKATLRFEGGYVNDPKDKGGETNLGITRKTYEQFLKKNNLPLDNLNMREIPEEHVLEIYKTMYWQPAGCDHLPPLLAQQVFDFAVNSGTKKAIQFLQAQVGAEQDGIFGPATKASVEQAVQNTGDAALARSYVQSRRTFIENAVAKGQIHAKFKKGLINRTNTLESYIPKAPVNKKSSKTAAYQQDWSGFVADTDRYFSDRHDLLLSLRENENGYAVGFQVNSSQVGVSVACEYWHFNKDELDIAKKVFNEVKKIAERITEEFETQQIHFALLSPKFKRALADVYTGYKEKSGLPIWNTFASQPNPEEDWRQTLYSGHYPSTNTERLNADWIVNTDEKSRQVEVSGNTSRSEIKRYKYAGRPATKDLITDCGLNWSKIASVLRNYGCSREEIADYNSEFLQYFFHLNS